MPPSRLRLTAQIQNEICAFIRRGSFPETAAEAAGIPRKVFRAWLARGKSSRASVKLRAFAAEVRKATAQARILAEMETVKKNPLAWLKHGPGRETADMPGWTLPARPRPLRPATQALVQPELAELCALLLRVLAPFPEARTAAAEVLAGAPPPPEPKS